jgi:hypothetical protein
VAWNIRNYRYVGDVSPGIFFRDLTWIRFETWLEFLPVIFLEQRSRGGAEQMSVKDKCLSSLVFYYKCVYFLFCIQGTYVLDKFNVLLLTSCCNLILFSQWVICVLPWYKKHCYFCHVWSVYSRYDGTVLTLEEQAANREQMRKIENLWSDK